MDQLSEDVADAIFESVIDELGDEVVEAIRADEREMILEFIRREENIYEVGEDLADMIEELGHYEDEGIH